MDNPLCYIKAELNSFAGCPVASSRLQKTSYCHMTKSDVVGDMYDLATWSSTKDAQLSATETPWHFGDNAPPVSKPCLSRHAAAAESLYAAAAREMLPWHMSISPHRK